MKFLILCALTLAVISTSCLKENVSIVILDSDFNQTKAQELLDDKWYDRPEQGEYGCEPNPGRCLMVVVVTGTAVSPNIVTGVINTIETGTGSQISTAFDNNETDLEILMPEYLVDGTIDGTYSVQNKGIFGTNSTAFIKFYDSNDVVERVVRLTK